jgi:DNA uptake protein ComE-like DNA-binding protein
VKNFFYFNSSNRRAIIALSILIVVIHFIAKFREDKALKEYDFTQFQQEVNRFKEKKESEEKVKFFASKRMPHNEVYKTPKEKKIIHIDINLADTLAFEQLLGIGKYFAKRICKFRNLLGGFYSKKQILEVYQMDSVRYDKIEEYLLVNEKVILKKNINEMNQYELRKHPYISSNLARSIVNYREEHGAYNSIYELYNLRLIDTLNFRKIVNYFTANEHNSFRGEN